MSKMLLLTRILLKSSESMVAFSKKKQRNPIWIYLLLAVALFPVALMIGSIVGDLYAALETIHQEGTLLALGFMSISLMIFFFGIFYVMNIFYFANDIETLLPLPLKPSEILGAKLGTAIIYEYFIAAIIYLPLIISFGIKSGGGILYYLYALVLFLVLPIIPLILASVIVMVIMRFTNIAKNKDRMRIIGGIIAILLAVGGNFAIQFYTQKPMDPNQLQSFFMENNALIELTTKWFPTSKFPAEALLNWNNFSGLAYTALFIGISLILVIVFLVLGEIVYFRGVTGVSETTAKRKKYSEAELTLITKESSPLLSLLFKEIRFLIRTPAYLMNCILSSFMLPFILIIVLFLNPNGTGQLQSLKGLLTGDINVGFFLAIVFAISVFFSASNSIAATAVSREGKNLFISKYLPVSYNTQLWAKVFSAVIISLLTVVLVLAIFVTILQPPILLLMFITIVLLLGVFFSSMAGLLFDLLYPKLDWVNEQRAVKGNMNTLFSLMISLVLAGVTIFVFSLFDLGVWGGFLILTGILLVFNIILIQLIAKKGYQWFEQIEE